MGVWITQLLSIVTQGFAIALFFTEHWLEYKKDKVPKHCKISSLVILFITIGYSATLTSFSFQMWLRLF